MKWTTEAPKVGGWYWYRSVNNKKPIVLFVYQDLAVKGISGEADHVGECTGEFQGPITPQEDAP